MTRPTFVEVDGRRTRVRVGGDPANPPVLLIHGIGRSMEDWSTQYERLGQSYRTIALDVPPGFGFFSERPKETITLPVLAEGVAGASMRLASTGPCMWWAIRSAVRSRSSYSSNSPIGSRASR